MANLTLSNLSFMLNFLKGIISSIAPGLASGSGAALMNRIFGMSKAEQQQNQFNAFEAQKNRDFQAQQVTQQNQFAAEEAEKNRAFQANQAATQYQRGVADMQAAGLNPALAYGQGGASAMSGSAASAPAPASGSAASGSARGLAIGLSDLMQMAKIKSDIDETQSRIALNEKQGNLYDQEANYKGMEIAFFQPLSDAKLRQIDSQLKTEAVERRLKESGISVNQAQESLLTKQALLAGIDTATRGELNNLEARLRIAQIGLTYANTSESRQRVETLKAEQTELLARAATEAALEGKYTNESYETLLRAGILEYDKKTAAYHASKIKLTYTLDCVGKVVGAIGGAVSIGSGIMTGLGAMRGANALSGMNALKLNPADSGKPGLVFAPANSSFGPMPLRQ